MDRRQFGFYMTNPYKHYTADTVIDELTDVVSKNGNLLLDISPEPDGTIPQNQIDVLRGAGDWLRIKGEAIYGATYWSEFQDANSNVPVRFTVKGGALYVTALEWPGEQLTLSGDLLPVGPASEIRLLGSDGAPLTWNRSGETVAVQMPLLGQAATTSEHAYTFKITTPGVHQLVRTEVQAPGGAASGQQFTAKVSVTNPGPGKTDEPDDPDDGVDGRVRLDVPDGWTVQPEQVNVGEIAPDSSRTVEFRVTSPTGAEPGEYVIEGHASYGRMAYQSGPHTVALGNVSVGKSATQSSTAFGGLADRAVDGNTDGTYNNGSVSHTDNDRNAWWQVDLGRAHDIDKVRVWNRSDCCTDRLRDYYVLVSDEPLPTSLDEALATPGVWASHQTAEAGRPTSVPVDASGRYVRIQLAGQNWLTIAEAEVFGEPPQPD